MKKLDKHVYLSSEEYGRILDYQKKNKLSFNNDYLTQNIDVHKLEQELATNILPKFF